MLRGAISGSACLFRLPPGAEVVDAAREPPTRPVAQLAVRGGDGDRALAVLDEEIATVSCAYVATAVTEIATLRGELFGRQEG